MEIIEMFFSIQGEGVHIGKPTFFVRTALCNLRCSWCVLGEAAVETHEGDEKPIDAVGVGEEVLAYDPSEQEVVYTRVEERHVRYCDYLLEIWLGSGHKLTVTPEHPIYTSQSWRLAKDLSIGDRVLVLDRQMGKSWARISDVQGVSRVEKVYNLTCSPLRNFFANGVLTHNCDTKYSWEQGVEMSVADIIKEVEKQTARSVCLTGGEPLLWKDSEELIHELVKRDYEVVVETSGSISIKDVPRGDGVCISMDIKCPSSGMQEKMEFDSIDLLRPGDQLKFVIADERDYEYAKEVIRRYRPRCEIVFQPEGGNRLLPLARWVLRDGLRVRVLPQLHRLIWPERDRGV
ncbi:MAG: radical SAM protein [Thermoplasmata archaeon]